jgi:flagellar hook-basal body complex protein FliE
MNINGINTNQSNSLEIENKIVNNFESKNEQKQNFSIYLNNAVTKLSDFKSQSDKIMNVSENWDKKVNLSDVLIQSQKSSSVLNTFVQLRNHFIDSYKEIMNIPV